MPGRAKKDPIEAEGGFKAPPVTGYNDQSSDALNAVNRSKDKELELAEFVEYLKNYDGLNIDPRWAAVAVTHFEQGFMALNRSVFKPNSPFHKPKVEEEDLMAELDK